MVDTFWRNRFLRLIRLVHHAGDAARSLQPGTGSHVVGGEKTMGEHHHDDHDNANFYHDGRT